MANPSEAEQVQLYLGAHFTHAAAQAIRTNAPGTPLLFGINATETVNGAPSVPDSYYLKDVNGNKIQTWVGDPGDFLLNLTMPAVQQFVAQYAAQQLTQNGFTYDGMFFDNVSTVISTFTKDVYGNPVQIDANNDGIADQPGPLDAAWSAGVYAMIADFKQLAPTAYVVGHMNQTPPDPRSLAVFNGDSFVFDAVFVREGTMTFGTLWNAYQQWFADGLSPVVTTIQSSPPSQIAYGYGYSPLTAALPSTVAFGQTFYPNMRFGLAMALMNNGFSLFDFGDSNSPTTWWYDEYGFDLGYPLTAATPVGSPGSSNMVVNGGFDGSLSPWKLKITSDGSGAATAALDSSTSEDGSSSAHVDVTSAATANWHIDLEEDNFTFVAGAEYQLQFWAKADSPLSFKILTQGGAPAYANYGLSDIVSVGTTWTQYSVSFIAPVNATDGRLEFFFGSYVGNYWLDDVQLVQAPSRIYRRDFTNGIVLLNGTNSTQTVSVGSGFEHFKGSQAPKHQYIVDDTAPAFTTTGSWIVDTFDTGFRTPNPPYYHAWNKTCHELDAASGSAQWNLGIPITSQYNIQVWLPAAPGAGNWTKNAVYTVMEGQQVLSTFTLDQSQAAKGDQWYTIATNLTLTAASDPVLQVSNGGSGPLIADAVHIYSSSRLNDGSAVTSVTLQPMDGILLRRGTPTQTIAFSALPNTSLTSVPLTISAAASSSLPVVFTSNTTSVCTVSGTTVTLKTTGSCSITASQAGNSSFAPASPVTQSFTVSASSSSSVKQPSQGTTEPTSTVSATPTSGSGTTASPSAVLVTPSKGSGTAQSFSGLFSDTAGATSLNAVSMLFNESLSGVNGCYLEYSPASNTISLKADDGTALAGTVTPGVAGSVSNSQCTVSGLRSKYTVRGNSAALTVAVTFIGKTPLTTYLFASDKNGSSTGWVAEGSWTP